MTFFLLTISQSAILILTICAKCILPLVFRWTLHMLIDPVLVDHQRLIKSRLSDEGIEFPTSSDLVSVVETFKPQIFNFFSVHGKIVYIAKSYSSFVLVCRHFNPASQFGLSCFSHNVHKEEFVVRKYDDFSLAVRDFTFVVEGLCSLARNEAAKEFSRG